jgi:hypothetical protein
MGTSGCFLEIATFDSLLCSETKLACYIVLLKLDTTPMGPSNARSIIVDASSLRAMSQAAERAAPTDSNVKFVLTF